jgi:mono/diheme cytochrome c family protein
MSADEASEASRATNHAGAWVTLGLFGLIAGGFLAYQALKFRPPPPPVDLAGDPLLEQGRVFYYERCAVCHGQDGLGDGPLAKSLAAPPPGDLTDNEWKHGDEPNRVLEVIARGIKGTSMQGWESTFDQGELNSLAAYVYYLAKQPVPAQLRGE